jgi:hypothetical protein
MIALFFLFLTLSVSPFKSKSRLEAENAALRHQLIVLQRRVRGRVQLTNGDRLFLVMLYRWFPSILKAITIIRPETLVRWHRAGFRRYWQWKSRSPGGRPKNGEFCILPTEKKRIADPTKRCNHHRRIVAVCCPELGEFIQ